MQRKVWCCLVQEPLRKVGVEGAWTDGPLPQKNTILDLQFSLGSVLDSRI